jgi:hypothetical protein
MCCFSRAVDLVADTNIFARPGRNGRQFVVYSMRLKAGEDVAMILPLPTPKRPAEDAVKFLNLEKYPDFFDDLASGFPVPATLGRAKEDAPKAPKPEPKLVVVEVGSFVASFVPTVKDFARLDEQFRLPASTWDALPQYRDWGFAVFQLKKGEKKIHPMAFDFPRADPRSLFFPTVHIHDGKVHAKANFDHWLYCQGASTMRWAESPQPAGMFMKKLDKAHGIMDPEAHVYRRRLQGELKNEDTYV